MCRARGQRAQASGSGMRADQEPASCMGAWPAPVHVARGHGLEPWSRQLLNNSAGEPTAAVRAGHDVQGGIHDP